MTKDQESVIFPSILLGIVIGFCIGFFIGWDTNKKYIKQLHWDELVKRGYAEQVETSLGARYRWKD